MDELCMAFGNQEIMPSQVTQWDNSWGAIVLSVYMGSGDFCFVAFNHYPLLSQFFSFHLI